MMKRTLILLVLILAQSGCSVFGQYTDEIYHPPRCGGKNMNG
jgi:hypothetical protein